ncbi:hypothetical protein BDV96DRAFT_508642, partial [Lophiotrema nucula]
MASDQARTIERLSREGLNHTILLKHCPLDQGKLLLQTSDTGLGALDLLPVELLHEAIGYLDVKSIFTLRRINRKAMTVVEGQLMFRKIMTHASDVFRGALSLEVAHKITLPNLLTKLCQQTCDNEDCVQLAPYIDLLAMQR